MVTVAMAVRFYTFFFEHPSSGCTFSIPGQVPPVKGIFCIAVIYFLYGSHFRVGGRAAVLIFLIEVRAGALVQIKAQAVAFLIGQVPFLTRPPAINGCVCWTGTISAILRGVCVIRTNLLR